MRVKHAIKKIVALAGGATMLGATVMGALAASDLTEWKDIFIKDGQWTGGHIVLGANAKTEDVIAAVGLAATLQEWAVTEEPVEVEGTIEVEGGVTKDLQYDTGLADGIGSTLDDSDISVLEDSTFDWEGENYDYHTEVVLTNNAKVTTSLVEDNDDYDGDPVIIFDAESVKYKYVIDDVNFNISQISSTKPLEIEFLGQKLKITSWSGNEITVEVAQEHYMKVGDTVTYDGKDVELVNIGSDSVVVSVGGETEIINQGAVETVNGVKIEVESIFYVDEQSERAAILKIGDEITKTYNSDEEYIGEDETNPMWVWDIDGANKYIGVKLNQYIGKGDYAPVKEGEALTLPNNFIKISFDALKNADKYHEYTMDIIPKTINSTGYNNVLRIISKDDDKGIVVGTDEVSEVYVTYNVSGGDSLEFWYTKGGDWYKGTTAKLENGDTVYTLSYDTGKLKMTDGSVDTIYFDLSISGNEIEGFGTKGDAEDTDITYGATPVKFGDWDGDALTEYGVVFKDVKNNLDDDEVVMEIPDDRVEAVVSVAPGQATATSSEVMTQVVNPLPSDIAILDTDYTSGPAIVVGGPCVNTLAAELMGNPETCTEGFEPGYGLIKLFPDKDTILVAGYYAEDTQAAVKVLENYENYLT
ncbi:hypothetical protein J7K74_00535, partial [Candidatus Woesearchaeota archaeon]|nr:hypothetical protein [Candidatus Woesearchaeota archaeon]